ncbi:MAG: hypothetical protein WCO55_01295 [Candidatus Falkowbacteria bacterium]
MKEVNLKDLSDLTGIGEIEFKLALDMDLDFASTEEAKRAFKLAGYEHTKIDLILERWLQLCQTYDDYRDFCRQAPKASPLVITAGIKWIETARTSQQAHAICNFMHDEKELYHHQCYKDALGTWNAISKYEAVTAQTLDEAYAAFNNAPDRSEAKLLAMERRQALSTTFADFKTLHNSASYHREYNEFMENLPDRWIDVCVTIPQAQEVYKLTKDGTANRLKAIRKIYQLQAENLPPAVEEDNIPY